MMQILWDKNSSLNDSGKILESATREVDTVSEITASISWMSTGEKSLSKILGKNYSFQAGNIFNLASAQ